MTTRFATQRGVLRTVSLALCAAPLGCAGEGIAGSGDAGPVEIAPASVVAGDRHACALAPDRRVLWCWGSNDSSQLGDRDRDDVPFAVGVRGLPPIALMMVTAGESHTCAVDSDRVAWCWGANGSGQLGIGSTGEPVSDPTKVQGDHRWLTISAGAHHSCAITVDSVAYCWGDNTHGQLGDGSTGAGSSTPQPVTGDLRFRMVSAGGAHSCGARASRAYVYCWGRNERGQLGIGTVGDHSAEPLLIALDTTEADRSAFHVAYDLDVGTAHSCFGNSTFGGRVFCWGANDRGQLGHGTISEAVATPDVVRNHISELVFMRLVSAGYDHGCGWDSGLLYCWGAGQGFATQIGTAWGTPAGGREFTCADRDASTVPSDVDHVLCWGKNDHGQVGDGTFLDREFPVLVIHGGGS